LRPPTKFHAQKNFCAWLCVKFNSGKFEESYEISDRIIYITKVCCLKFNQSRLL
jgi:hypothetical protein